MGFLQSNAVKALHGYHGRGLGCLGFASHWPVTMTRMLNRVTQERCSTFSTVLAPDGVGQVALRGYPLVN